MPSRMRAPNRLLSHEEGHCTGMHWCVQAASYDGVFKLTFVAVDHCALRVSSRVCCRHSHSESRTYVSPSSVLTLVHSLARRIHKAFLATVDSSTVPWSTTRCMNTTTFLLVVVLTRHRQHEYTGTFCGLRARRHYCSGR